MKFKQATWNFTKNLTLKPILLEAVVSLSHFCHSWSKLPLSQRQKSAKICKNANFMYTGISEFFFSFVLVNDEAVHILSEKDNISNLLCEQCYHIFFYCFLSTLNMKIVLWKYYSCGITRIILIDADMAPTALFSIIWWVGTGGRA